MWVAGLGAKNLGERITGIDIDGDGFIGAKHLDSAYRQQQAAEGAPTNRVADTIKGVAHAVGGGVKTVAEGATSSSGAPLPRSTVEGGRRCVSDTCW